MTTTAFVSPAVTTYELGDSIQKLMTYFNLDELRAYRLVSAINRPATVEPLPYHHMWKGDPRSKRQWSRWTLCFDANLTDPTIR